MTKISIRNGIVFDPINKIEGEIKDILIENGKIVDKFSSEKDIKQIDAKSKVVIPSALDIHSHMASYQLNLVRLLGTKNQQFRDYFGGLKLIEIAKNYITQGYSFILEANIYPSFAKQTLFDFSHIPVLDKAYLLNISNLWALELEYQKGLYKEGAIFLSDLLMKLKAFGVKVYNPFEAESWNWNLLREDVAEKGRLYNFTPLDVYLTSIKIAEYLSLPHSVHAHIEGYESHDGKNNLMKVLNEVKALKLDGLDSNNKEQKRNQIFHLAHASAYNMDGNNSDILQFFNANQQFDLDVGFVGFNPINPILTSDRRLINSFNGSNQNPTILRASLESEGDCFIALREFKKSNINHCQMWGNALDIALNMENKWQVQFTVNFPIYSDIRNTPQIYEWLLNSKARETFMSDMNPQFLKQHPLVNNSNEYSFNDLIIITRASPAKSLGLGDFKGNLGPGADADINILDLNINTSKNAKDTKSIIKAFENIEYILKEGNIVKKQNELFLDYHGKIFWSNGKTKIEESDKLINKKKEFYQKYSSVFYDSFDTTIKKEILREV